MPNKDEIIKRLVANLAEVITEEELRERIDSGQPLTHYIGFEISGYVHLGTGLMTALVMKDLTDLGVNCTIWLADWHTWINNKLDGNRTTAANIGVGYFAEALRASFIAIGGDPAKLDIRLASSYYDKNPMHYWELVIAVAKHTTLARMMRSVDITGKEAGENTEYARTMYPVMQAADIFYQNIDIAHAGMDQRKIHVIVRDVADKIRPGQPKPIILHHPLLQSLNGKTKEDKMSKSDPGAAVFVHDSMEDITHKIGKAFCPEKETEHNPILNWARHVLFWSASQRTQQPFRIEREEKHGGTVEFGTYQELETAYAAGDVHPMDLKAAVAKELTELLAPVRAHFEKPEIAAMKAELDKVLANK
jgi:tyrosyl-tRNA synthetase